jgi:hypothetical protein
MVPEGRGGTLLREQAVSDGCAGKRWLRWSLLAATGPVRARVRASVLVGCVRCVRALHIYTRAGPSASRLPVHTDRARA